MFQRFLQVSWILALAGAASVALCLASNVALADSDIDSVATPPAASPTLTRLQVNEVKIERQALRDERTAQTQALMLNALKIKVYEDWFADKQPSVLKNEIAPSLASLLAGAGSTYAVRNAQMAFVTQLAGEMAPIVARSLKGAPAVVGIIVAYYFSRDYSDYATAIASLNSVRPEDRLQGYRNLLAFRDLTLDNIKSLDLRLNQLNHDLRKYEAFDKK